MADQPVTPQTHTLGEALSSGSVLLGDGAAGTLLMSAGLPLGVPPDLWNAEKPDEILKMHQAYIDAGAQIILTNTFGATRLKLEKSGLNERSRELNLAGAALARQAAGMGAHARAYVAGDIGPTGELMKPYGNLEYDAAVDVFAEQAAALAEAGVDAIWIETMMDLEEARAAVTAARRVTNLPVLCSLSFSHRARTMMGVSAQQAAEELWPLGLAAIGANCGQGLDVVEEALQAFAAALPGSPLIAKPNAGLPRIEAGRAVYDTGPAAFAERAASFISLGARIIGACCGSTPEYISSLAAAI